MAFTSECLVLLSERDLYVWNVLRATRHSLVLSPPIKVDSCSRWVCMQTSLFCSGGFGYYGEGTQEAYAVDQEGTVLRLCDMSTGRRNHGLWFDSIRLGVVVFGGGMTYIGGISLTGDHGTTQESNSYLRL